MTFWLIYIPVAILVFFTALVFVARIDAENAPRRDLTDYFLFGLLLFLFGAIWPVSAFGMLSVVVFRHIRHKADKERYITEELSRG